MSCFYPKRDVAGGALSSEPTKSQLANDFNEKLLLDLNQSEAFKAQLEKYNALLQKCNAVDYSLFLIRIPASSSSSESAELELKPTWPTEPPSWPTCIMSADGQYIYRASVLDFFSFGQNAKFTQMP